MFYYITLYYIILCFIISYYIISFYDIYYHIILYHIMLYHIMLYYIILCYIIFYHHFQLVQDFATIHRISRAGVNHRNAWRISWWIMTCTLRGKAPFKREIWGWEHAYFWFCVVPTKIAKVEFSMISLLCCIFLGIAFHIQSEWFTNVVDLMP